MPLTPITKGAPFIWQQVIDNVTAYWPENIPPLSSSDEQGGKINASFLAMMAMMIPPSTAARPVEISGLTPSGDQLQGQINEFIGRGPMIAADTFYFLVSGQFATFDAAKADLDLGSFFATLNIDGTQPDLPLYLGMAFTDYTDGAMHICTASVAARAPSP